MHANTPGVAGRAACRSFAAAVCCAAWLCTAPLQQAHAAVELTGVDKQLAADIRGYLQLDDETCKAPAWRVRRLYAAAGDEIRSALEVSGYYAPVLEQSLEMEGACWQARFAVDPGEPVRLRNVVLRVDTGAAVDGEFSAALTECALRPGEVFTHAAYEACKRRIQRVADDRGYFSGAFTAQRVDVYPDHYAADIALEFLSGPRYSFGEISFEQAVLDENFAARFVEFRPGDSFDAQQLRDLQLDLASSRYFDQINIATVPRGSPHYDVPVLITLTPGKARQFTYGVGYATDLGVRARFELLNRRRNESGHQSSLQLSASEVLSEAVFSYRIPLRRRPATDSFAISTGYLTETTDTTTSDLFTLGVSLAHKRSNGWVRKWFTDLRLEDYTAGATDSGYSKLVLPGLNYSFAPDDFPPRPLAGHRTQFYVRGTSDVLISDTSFVQLYAQTKRIFGLWRGGRVLMRGEYGTTFIDGLETLPTSVRYFAGGDVSVRGYAFKDLGPEDAFGEVVGGKHVLTGSVELDQLVARNWSVAAFVDSGNAFDNYDDINVKTGVGAGVRWYSLLGPIRFDIAVPLANDAPDDYRIVITMGPDL